MSSRLYSRCPRAVALSLSLGPEDLPGDVSNESRLLTARLRGIYVRRTYPVHRFGGVSGECRLPVRGWWGTPPSLWFGKGDVRAYDVGALPLPEDL
ncbi:hypothetical protein GCM10010156_28630 [Planobispora rosea]|uniref:Uncharacterized protein n=1 Tax=Planobispora rosea TaxID=35762 RepID=A0A8J3W9P7_PLARO|nr:hypothetical protein GCM10010156_28630 [Planobispora rosea]GIH81949.1 hypothetical protein Pro02_03570 [Planobispora rosea]